MLPSTKLEITYHFRERYVERVLGGMLRINTRIIQVTSLDFKLVDPVIRRDFLGARHPTKVEKKMLLAQWKTPTGQFHPSNVILFNPHTKTMFICELKPGRIGVFVGRTCYKMKDAGELTRLCDYIK